MKDLKLALLIALLILSSILMAEEWVNYTTDNSPLKSNVINDVAVDKTENVWVATTKGLARFDGINWSIFTTSNSGLPSDIVHTVVIAPSGKIIMGTNSGLAVYDGISQGQNGDNTWRGWTVYNMSNSPLPRNVVNTIAVDTSGAYWIGMLGGGGLAKFDGSNWKIYNVNNSELPNNYIYALAITPDNKLWIGTNYGLCELSNNSWTVYYTNNSKIPSNSIRALAIANNNTVYVGTSDAGFATFYDKSTWTTFNKSNSPILDNSITSIVVINSRLFWLGTEKKGLFKVNNDIWTNYQTNSTDIVDDEINSISLNGSTWKWVGTMQGLSLHKEISVTGIRVSPETLIIPKEQVYPLSLTILPANATNQKIAWQISNPNVLSLVGNGTLITTSPGVATVGATAEDGGYIATCEVEVTGTVEAPKFTPNGGEYKDSVLISISTTTENANIFYTTNGDDPTPNSTKYTEPITITTSTTFKAKAFRDHWEPSVISTAEYLIVTSVSEDEIEVPKATMSVIAYPNPVFKGVSRSSEIIYFDLYQPGSDDIWLDIYNLKGQKIKSTQFKNTLPGKHTVQLDLAELKLLDGIYLYRFKIGSSTQSGRFTIIR